MLDLKELQAAILLETTKFINKWATLNGFKYNKRNSVLTYGMLSWSGKGGNVRIKLYVERPLSVTVEYLFQPITKVEHTDSSGREVIETRVDHLYEYWTISEMDMKRIKRDLQKIVLPPKVRKIKQKR